MSTTKYRTTHNHAIEQWYTVYAKILNVNSFKLILKLKQLFYYS